jgi:2',3'-cyclic-nucleotide 2'-phosphodiesterase (5'-nucleotidase family)
MRRLALFAVFAFGCKPKAPVPAPEAARKCGEHADGSRTFGILHINDVYRIEGLLDDTGGLGRLRRLRTELEQSCPELLFTHGGDLLSPSMLSKVKSDVNGQPLYGEHMVDLLSRMDGDPTAFDDRMFIAIGNHEFDNGGDTFGPRLSELIDQSGGTWLDTNITWSAFEQTDKDSGETTTYAAPSSAHLAKHKVVEVAGLKVGIFGMTLDMKSEVDGKVVKKRAFFDTLDNHAKVATDTIAAMGETDVQLAVTHLDVSGDKALLAAVPDLDLVLGGHNHNAMTEVVDGRFVLKADADAATVRVVYVTVASDGTITVEHDDTDLTDDIKATTLSGASDPTMQERVDYWEAYLDRQYCGAEHLGCLTEQLTIAGNDFHAAELDIRRFETNVGDLAADLALEAYADQGAQLSFMNSGGMRLNQTIPEGAPFKMRQQEELFPYSAPVFLIELTGEELQGVADRAVQAWEGNGHWLQISGWGYIHNPDANDGAGSATRLHLLPRDGAPVPIDPQATYKVVANEYLVTKAYGDRDGYTFPARYLGSDDPKAVPDVKQLFGAHLKQNPTTTLAVDGRICNPTRRPEAPCRIPAE